MIFLVEREERKQKKVQWIALCSLQRVFILGEKMKLIILTKDFYAAYGHLKEILKKQDRPYACVEIELDGLTFAIPFRHHINHGFSFHTIGEAGLDFTKAIVITDSSYISSDRPTIESAEFSIIKKEEQKIKYQFKRFLQQYRKALKRPEVPRNARMIAYSALQYFKEYL